MFVGALGNNPQTAGWTFRRQFLLHHASKPDETVFVSTFARTHGIVMGYCHVSLIKQVRKDPLSIPRLSLFPGIIWIHQMVLWLENPTAITQTRNMNTPSRFCHFNDPLASISIDFPFNILLSIPWRFASNHFSRSGLFPELSPTNCHYVLHLSHACHINMQYDVTPAIRLDVNNNCQA